MKAWTSLILFICMALSLIAINVQVPVSRIDKQIDVLTHEFSMALTSSRMSLAALSNKIMADQIFSQNLGWNLTNSVSKFLEGNLQPGQIDALVVYDPTCRILAAAGNIALPAGPCIIDRIKNTTLPTFVFQNTESVPLLTVISQLNLAGTSNYFVASVMLDKKWLSDHPDLSNIFMQLEAKISSHNKASGSILLENGQTIDGNPAAVISSTNMTVRAGNYIANKVKINLAGIASFFLLMSFFAAILLLTFWHLQIQKTLTHQERLLEFCSKLLPKNQQPTSLVPSETNTQPSSDLLSQIKTHIEQLMTIKAQQQALLEKEIASLATQYDAAESELMTTKELLLHSKHHESLASQMQASTQCFISKIADIRQKAADINVYLAQGIMDNASGTLGIIDGWQRALKAQSPRKFLRSLSETVDPSGENELDGILKIMAKNSSSLMAQSLDLSTATKELLHNIGATLAIADHWQMLANQTNTAISALKLQDLLGESHELVQLVPNLPSYRLTSQFSEDISMENLEIPKVTITSAFYHLFLCLLETAKAMSLSNLSLRVTSKQKAGHKVLIISISNENKEAINIPFHAIKQAQHHCDIASALLLPFNIRLIKLPTVEGLAAIMMSWHESVNHSQLPVKTAKPCDVAESLVHATMERVAEFTA